MLDATATGDVWPNALPAISRIVMPGISITGSVAAG